MSEVTTFEDEKFVTALDKAHEGINEAYEEGLKIGKPSQLLTAIENIGKCLLVWIDELKEKWGV